MENYKFKVGDKVKQNGKGTPFVDCEGLVGVVSSVNYGKDRGDYSVNQVWVSFDGESPLYYRDYELDLVEAKQEFVAHEDIQVGKAYVLMEGVPYCSKPKAGDVVFVTEKGFGGAMLKNTTAFVPEHTPWDRDGSYHLHFTNAKLTEIPETVTPKVETTMTKYVTTTTEIVPAQTKVTKTINKLDDISGPEACYLSIVPNPYYKSTVDIVVGARWANRIDSNFTKRGLGELIEIFKEVHEAMEDK